MSENNKVKSITECVQEVLAEIGWDIDRMSLKKALHNYLKRLRRVNSFVLLGLCDLSHPFLIVNGLMIQHPKEKGKMGFLKPINVISVREGFIQKKIIEHEKRRRKEFLAKQVRKGNEP